MRPAVAISYLKEVTKDFEIYAKKNYLAALDDVGASDPMKLAAVSYVASRGIKGHESALQEAFTTRYKGKIGDEIMATCLDALLDTSEDRVATARFLALVVTGEDPPPAARLCRPGLKRLTPECDDALLTELAAAHTPAQLARLAQLLAETSNTSSPEPLAFWKSAQETERKEAAAKWGERIQAARSKRK
jgi:hypothetical protein